jgi:hypothetical protein
VGLCACVKRGQAARILRAQVALKECFSEIRTLALQQMSLRPQNTASCEIRPTRGAPILVPFGDTLRSAVKGDARLPADPKDS